MIRGRQENRPIINFFEKYFTKENIQEFLDTGSIKSLDEFKAFKETRESNPLFKEYLEFKEFQAFKEKCLTHYWRFDLANSHEIYELGSRQEKELLDIVKTKGGIYKQFYDEIRVQKR